MPDFEKLQQEAEKEIEGHPRQVDEAVSRGEQEVDRRVGQDRASDVQKAGDELEKELGTFQAPQPPDQQ